MFKHWKWTGLLCTVLVAITLVSSGLIAGRGKGKPPKDDGGTTDVPVVYQVAFFDMPCANVEFWIYDCNNYGQTVGYMSGDCLGGYAGEQRAFVYNPVESENAIDLNEIVFDIPDGWVIRRATAINATGDIAAYIRHQTDPDLPTRAAMIDMSATPPQLHLIDEDLLLNSLIDYRGELCVAADMNDDGDIIVSYERTDGTIGLFVYNFGVYDPLKETVFPTDLGVDGKVLLGYRVNNPVDGRGFQVAGKLQHPQLYGIFSRCFIYTHGEGMTILDPYVASNGSIYEWLEVGGINDSGQVAGGLHIDNPKRNKWLQVIWDVSYTTSTSVGTIVSFNNSADFVTRNALLFHSQHGEVDPYRILDPTDPNASLVVAAGRRVIGAMSDRDSTDFPVLFSIGDYVVDGVTVRRGAVLYPVLKP